MVEKILRSIGGPRLAAALGCVLGAIACAGCSSAGAPSGDVLTKVPPTARAKDYTATSEYIHARAEAIRTTMAALPLDASSTEAVIAHVRSECAGALRGTPAAATIEKGHVTKVELASAVLLLDIFGSIHGRWASQNSEAPLAESAARTFAARVASLRWADPGITNVARAFVGVEEQLFAIPPIDVCQVIRGWAASGYRKVPGAEELLRPHGAVGRAWRHALLAIGCRGRVVPIEKTLLAVLHPYERSGDSPTTRQIEEMETSLWVAFGKSERGHLEALWRLLGLPPPQREKTKGKLRTSPPVTDCSSLA
jgi:hypothetical protein